MTLSRAFATVGGATMASRVLGFAREVMIAALLGTGPIADAFYAAFSVPNLFRRFLAEGAFNSAFIPLFARKLETGGADAARAFAETIFSVLIATLLILTALMQLFMPAFVDLIVPGYRNVPGKHEMTVAFARVMMPYLFCLSLVAMLSGILNSFQRYFLAALAPVLLNVVLITVLALCLLISTGNSEATGIALSWGVLCAGIAQLLLLVFGARQAGFSMTLRWPKLTESVKRLLILAAPTALATGIVQINLFVGRIIASGKDGAITTLNFADRIYQLPLGVVGIAIGVVLLPELTRALRGEHLDVASDTQNRSLEFALLLTLPAAVALMVIPTELVRMLYEHGAFTAENTRATALVLAAFAAGLPSFVLIKVFLPGYFAREDTRTPMIYAGVGAVVNVTGSLLLFPVYEEVGIAIATSVAGWVNALLLFATLRRRGFWTFDAPFRRRSPRLMIASIAMGGVLFGSASLVASLTSDTTALIADISGALLLVIAGLVSYGLVALLIGGVDKSAVRKALRRKR